MTDRDALVIKPLPCRSAAARLASSMALQSSHVDELGQVGASLRHCYGQIDCNPDGNDPDNGDGLFQDLLAQLS